MSNDNNDQVKAKTQSVRTVLLNYTDEALRAEFFRFLMDEQIQSTAAIRAEITKILAVTLTFSKTFFSSLPLNQKTEYMTRYWASWSLVNPHLLNGLWKWTLDKYNALIVDFLNLCKVPHVRGDLITGTSPPASGESAFEAARTVAKRYSVQGLLLYLAGLALLPVTPWRKFAVNLLSSVEEAYPDAKIMQALAGC